MVEVLIRAGIVVMVGVFILVGGDYGGSVNMSVW